MARRRGGETASSESERVKEGGKQGEREGRRDGGQIQEEAIDLACACQQSKSGGKLGEEAASRGMGRREEMWIKARGATCKSLVQFRADADHARGADNAHRSLGGSADGDGEHCLMDDSPVWH